MAVALILNPDLRAKRLERGEAEALLISAGLWPNPVLAAGFRPGIGAPSYSIDADLLFELLRPWERAARKAAATARGEEASAGAAAEEWDIASRVRSTHLEVLVAEQSLRLLDEETALHRRVLDLARRGRDAGERTALDVAAAERDLAGVDRSRRLAASEVDRVRRELNGLLGLRPDHVLQLSASGKPLEVTLYEEITDEDLKRRVLEGRFELRAKEAAYRRAEEELRLAVLGQYPRVSLGPSYSHEPREGNYLGIGASIEIPVSTGTRAVAEKELAGAPRGMRGLLLIFWAPRSTRGPRAAGGSKSTQERCRPSRAARDIAMEPFAREVSAPEWAAAQDGSARPDQPSSIAGGTRQALIDLRLPRGARRRAVRTP